MKKAKSKPTPDPHDPANAPEAKLSDAVLELAHPFFEPLGAFPSIHAIRNVLMLVIVGWNAYAMEKPVWGSPGAIDRARARLLAPHYPTAVSVIFEEILEQRAAKHGSDLRLVGEWSIASTGTGGFTLHCETRLTTADPSRRAPNLGTSA